MRRTMIALALAMAFAAVGGTLLSGCPTSKSGTPFCDLYMRCVGYDEKIPGCRKSMTTCLSAYDAEEFSSACITKANTTLDAGTKVLKDYCADLCAVCD